MLRKTFGKNGNGNLEDAANKAVKALKELKK